MIRAGQLRQEVDIQSSTESRSSYTVDYSWATDATVRASVKQLSGEEVVKADHEKSTRTFEVRIRYYSGLTAENRLLWGSRVLNIESVINVDERDTEMRLICKEAA